MCNKIYIIIPDLSAGGAERVAITIARILHEENFEVQFVNLGFKCGEMLKWIEPEFKMFHLNSGRVLSAFSKLRQFMKSHDGIYFSSREHVNVVGLLAAKMTNRLMVVRIPNMPRNNLTSGLSGLKMKVIKTINHALLKTAKVVIAQNEEMRKQLLDYYKLPEDVVITINNPVDADYVRASAVGKKNPFNADEMNFLSVCNVAYSKGIDVLEAAWPRVKTKIQNAHMYIVGRNISEYAQNLVKKSQELKDFTFLGFQNNPYSFMKYCDVFVLPSRMEGFPNVVLEAQCFNRPVASTLCVDVIKDLIQEGKNGYYCNIEDPEALAQCIIQAVELKDIKNYYKMFDKEHLVNCFK